MTPQDRAKREHIAIRTMVDLERELSDLGLYVTRRKVNEAQQEIGWEIAREREKRSAKR